MRIESINQSINQSQWSVPFGYSTSWKQKTKPKIPVVLFLSIVKPGPSIHSSTSTNISLRSDAGGRQDTGHYCFSIDRTVPRNVDIPLGTFSMLFPKVRLRERARRFRLGGRGGLRLIHPLPFPLAHVSRSMETAVCSFSSLFSSQTRDKGQTRRFVSASDLDGWMACHVSSRLGSYTNYTTLPS
ncbi:hypothetical protein LZ31DRAFT_69995 [Colletotrichum somersetense]|nr:hypothetical protein LZ31DRAFT_69995 [Colletotrichum somersetense]